MAMKDSRCYSKVLAARENSLKAKNLYTFHDIASAAPSQLHLCFIFISALFFFYFHQEFAIKV